MLVMTTHRFDGIPMNMDRLSDVERSNLRGYLQDKVAHLAGDLAVLTAFEHPELPLGDIVQFPQPELPDFPPAAA